MLAGMRPRLALLALAAVLGCSAPPPASPPASSPTPAPPAAAPAPDEPPTASLAGVAPSKESGAGVRAKIIFTNPGKRPCRFLGYKLSWAGSSKAIKLETFADPPGETRERWLKMSPDDGDLSALTPASARVEVQTECGP
jgi:hypothetical protein